MKDLGFPDDQGISTVAVSEPFPLFTPAAIKQMRAEILSEKVRQEYQFSSNLSKSQLRGYAADCGPFTYAAWNHPETLALISKIARIDLIPQMDYEIGHINLSINKQDSKNSSSSTSNTVDAQNDIKPIVDWHTDAYPFVCVLMLSDCTGMIGGETALRTGHGEIMKVRGPQMGSAVVLQGRYIEHQALSATGTTERITAVTSFRPKSPHIKDDTVLTTVRPVSDLQELYFQYNEYRLEMLQERIKHELETLRSQKGKHGRFDLKATKGFLKEQADFLTIMNTQMVDEDQVTKGSVGESHLRSKDLVEESRKKREAYQADGA